MELHVSDNRKKTCSYAYSINVIANYYYNKLERVLRRAVNISFNFEWVFYWII